MLFLAKSPFWLFLQDIKSGKNTTSIFTEKEDIGQRMDTREHLRDKRGGATRPLYLAAWAHPKSASGTTSPSVFDIPPHIYGKTLDLEEQELSHNRAPLPPRSSFRRQMDPGFLLRWRDLKAVFTAIFTAFISIDHELLHHHHVWVVRCRHVRWMGIGWDWSCNATRCSRF